MAQPRNRIQQMPEYHPPLGNRDTLRLDFNENTVGCSPAVLAAIQNLSSADLTRYPQREPVEALVAQHLGLSAPQVMLTNGVDEAIHVLFQAFLEEGDELLLPVPTYSMYEIYASSTDASIVRVQAGASFRFPFEALLAAITPKTKLIAIANPNSPTGSVAPREQLVALAQAAPHALILVDEAYYHFYGQTVLHLLDPGSPETLPNLIVARTFSKAFGLAGLRIGLLAGRVEHVQWVRRVLSPYSVNSVALVALKAALEDQSYLDWYVREVKQARIGFLLSLTQLGFEYWPTEANFVLVKIGPAHREFAAAMRRQGILVRDRSADPGCDGLVRITIGASDQMQQAVSAISHFVSSHISALSL